MVVTTTPTPDELPFAPISTVAVRPRPTLMPNPAPTPLPTSASPSEVLAEGGSTEPYINRIPDISPTEVPLPKTCLRAPFASDVSLIPGCTHYDIELSLDVVVWHGGQRSDRESLAR
ncbi:MAG: hypothetical protein ACP5JG_03385 [Anaerolineae bacterium]